MDPWKRVRSNFATLEPLKEPLKEKGPTKEVNEIVNGAKKENYRKSFKRIKSGLNPKKYNGSINSLL